MQVVRVTRVILTLIAFSFAPKKDVDENNDIRYIVRDGVSLCRLDFARRRLYRLKKCAGVKRSDIAGYCITGSGPLRRSQASQEQNMKRLRIFR